MLAKGVVNALFPLWPKMSLLERCIMTALALAWLIAAFALLGHCLRILMEDALCESARLWRRVRKGWLCRRWRRHRQGAEWAGRG